MQEPSITSRHNPRLKQAARLRDTHERRATGRLIVDGARETLRALQAGVTPVEAFWDVGNEGQRTQEALAELLTRGVTVHATASGAFEKLAYGDRSDGLVLVGEAPVRGLADLEPTAEPLILVVEGVEKPGNLGAILRTADGAGVDAVVLADALVDLFNPNAIRASVGAVFRESIAVCTTAEAVAWLSQIGATPYTTRPKAEQTYTEADYRGATAIVVGSEALGLSPAWDGPGSSAVSLPMHGVADSLNVSAATAVLLYEARRQRDAARP